MKNNNLPFTVRRATERDARALATLGFATFTETFGHLYREEDLEDFLAGVRSVDAFTRKLRDSDLAIWIAELSDTTPVGFITAGPCKLPVENCEPAAGEIQQLYVLAQYHNLHLGSRLMEIALEWLEAQGRAPLYIGVWSENYRAQRFYARYGFSKVGEYGFSVGATVDREFILKQQIHA